LDATTPILFAYGTLREPLLLEGVLGHPLDGLDIRLATAPGFRTVFYPGRIYPALTASDGAIAEGLAIGGLSARDMEILDLFEGEEYVRRELAIHVGAGAGKPAPADADRMPKTTLNVTQSDLSSAVYYHPLAAIAPDAPPWSFGEWRRRHGETMIVAEGESAAALRAQLIAMGGNKPRNA
jgi:hypothetical protein